MSNSQVQQQILARKASILQGDAARIAKQREAGKMTARERVAALLDEGSFVEIGALVSHKDEGCGVVTGYGTIQERPVYLFAQDATVRGGAMGKQQADKVLRLLDLALKTGAPVIALCDSNGVRLDEGVEAMNAYTRIYHAMAKLSGVCPTVALLLGPAIGGAALLSRLCDVTIIVEKTASLMVYGSQVLGAVAGQTVTEEKSGGAAENMQQGTVSLTAATEQDAFALCTEVLDFFPTSNIEDAPFVEADDMNRLLASVDPDDSQALMAALADDGRFVELQAGYGKALRIALAHVGERSVGLVVSNAQENDGQLTAEAANKAARFIRMCDCFSLPVITLVNSKGVAVPAPDRQAEVMTALSRLVCAYAEATTAKISIVVGDAIGQSYMIMAGAGCADMTYAWPGAMISALNADAAVQLLYADELKQGDQSPAERRAELEESYAATVADAVSAAATGLVDDVINPAETRILVIAAMEMLASKRESNPPKKHGNLPM